MDFWWLLGYAKTKFHSPDKTLDLPLKSSSPITLRDFCSLPSITPPCRLTPFLPSGHLQTINTVVTKTDVPIHYRRTVFDSDDPNYPGTFVVDFVSHVDGETKEKSAGDADEGQRRSAKTRGNLYCPKRTRLFEEQEWTAFEKGSDDSTPMLVVLHGLSGGSYEVYLKEVLAPLTVNSKEEQAKWEACVVTARGCAGSAITSGVLFNARATWDYRQIVRWLRKKFPNRPLFGLGFSLGANILVNYLGEEGDRCELHAAVACSNPWNLAAGNAYLLRSLIGRKVYMRAMGSNTKQVFRRHLDEARKHPHIDIEKILSIKTLYEFDRELQCPCWGYPTVGAYHRDASSTEPLLNVRIPLFAINAEDDPVAPLEALPFEEIKLNPYAVLCTTSMGGHLSWFESGGGRWFVKPASNFLRKMAEEVDLKAVREARSEPSKTVNPAGAIFHPLRRKLLLPVSTQLE